MDQKKLKSCESAPVNQAGRARQSHPAEGLPAAASSRRVASRRKASAAAAVVDVAAKATGVASFPEGVKKRHLSIVGMLGGIGFTMCLLLTEVALSGSARNLPKLAVLIASGVAAVLSGIAMRLLPVLAK